MCASSSTGCRFNSTMDARMRPALRCVRMACEWRDRYYTCTSNACVTYGQRPGVARGTRLIFVRLNPVERLRAMAGSRLSRLHTDRASYAIDLLPRRPRQDKSRRPPRFREAVGSLFKQILDVRLRNESLSSFPKSRRCIKIVWTKDFRGEEFVVELYYQPVY